MSGQSHREIASDVTIERPETVPVTSGPPVGPLAALLAAVLIIGAGIAGRIGEVTTSSIGPSAPPSAPDSAASTSSAGPVARLSRLISPRPDVLWYRSGLVRVRGLAEGPIGPIEATVFVGGRIIGATILDVGPDGHFAGWVPITPPEIRARAWLQLADASDPSLVLARSHLQVEAGDAVLIWTPTDPDEPLQGDRIVVSGPLLSGVDEVRIRLTDEAGQLVSEASGPAIAMRDEVVGDGLRHAGLGYRVELPLRSDHPRGRTHLYVFAIDAETGAIIDRADTRLTLGG